MAENSKFEVFWKGENLGSFTLDELMDGLDRGKFGLLYAVRIGNNEVLLRDFLSNTEKYSVSSKKNGWRFGLFSGAVARREQYLGCAVAGLSFIGWIFLAVAVLMSLKLLKDGKYLAAAELAGAAAVAYILGRLFFSFAHTL